jgi:hypothetical protein
LFLVVVALSFQNKTQISIKINKVHTKTQGVFGYYNIIYIIAGLASDDINDIIIRTKNQIISSKTGEFKIYSNFNLQLSF